MSILIEKGVPLTPRIKGELRLAMDAMSVGDSFVIGLHKQGAVACTKWFLRPKKFATRRLSNTEIRVWRTE